MVLNENTVKRLRVGTCPKDCYGSCVFLGEWNDNALEIKFLSAKPMKQHPFTNGFFCTKFNHREKMIYHPQRIKSPLVQQGGKGNNHTFKNVTLQKVLEIVAGKLIQVKKKFGSKSIIAAFNAGNNGLISRYGPLRLFGKLECTITTGGICNEGGCAGLSQLFGTYSITNPFQITNKFTELIVVWGSDLTNRNIHAYYLVKKAQKRGVILIVVDSRKTKIAQESDLFIFTKPGTDHLLAQLIIKKLIEKEEYDKWFLKEIVDGYEALINEVTKINQDKILEQLEINKTMVSNIVNLLIKHRHHTIFNVGYGVQKDYYGGRIVQIIALVQILLGNFGKPGSGLIYSQSDFNSLFSRPILDYITQITPNSKVDEIKLINLGKTLSNDKYKMIFIYNFNPASSLPDHNQVIKALNRKDLFSVVLDCFLNETTKYANIVIPTKFALETYDLITPYYIPGISINQAGPCPYRNCVSNYEFFQQLAWKVGLENDPIFNEDEESLFKKCLTLLPFKIQRKVKKQGYYLLFGNNSIPFKNLNFPTFNGHIQIDNIKVNFDKGELKERLKRYGNEFLLITPSHQYYMHSQFGQLNPEYLEVFQKVFLSSLDIKNLGLKIGEEILVSNKLGSAVFILAENDQIQKGVALIYSGSPLEAGDKPNVNIFIPSIPEELGFSGVYNSAKIFISRKSN